MASLRTLTKKSKLGFGNGAYKDLTIQRIIDLKGKRGRFIPNLYFNKSGLSFNDEILNELGITEEYRIEKPGSDSDMYLKFIEDKGLPQHSRVSNSIMFGKHDRISKGRLQSYNHHS